MMANMEMNEPRLLLAWRGGDRRAGRVLFAKYLELLRNFFATRAASDPEDLVQTTLLTCISIEHRFETRSSFRTFLLGIARHVLLKHWRTRGRLREVDFDEQSCVEFGADPSTIHARAQSMQRLLDALRRLPLRAQILLELYYWQELRGRELAEAMGLSEAAVWSRLHRARLELADALGSPHAIEFGDSPWSLAFERWSSELRARRKLPSPQPSHG